jgi:hypothetical protein
MNDLTQMIERVEKGDGEAAAELLPLVYEELRKLAAARMAQEASEADCDLSAAARRSYWGREL